MVSQDVVIVLCMVGYCCKISESVFLESFVVRKSVLCMHFVSCFNFKICSVC